MGAPEDAIRSEIAAVVEAVEILSPDTFRIADEPPLRVAPAQPLAGLYQPHPYAPAPLPSAALVIGLQSVLYARCYSHCLGQAPAAQAAPPDPWLVSRLSQANASRDRWDPGWQVYDLRPDGHVFVLKGDHQRSAMPGEYLAEGIPGQPPLAGSTVTLRVARESQHLQPGFYFMFSEVPPDIWDEYFLIRFYFNCTAQGTPELVAYITSTLNLYQVPYRMKALTDASQYTRTDSMVLYCARRYFQVVARIVECLPAAAGRHLASAVPLFTKRLRAGVGLAEDPGNGESFGMNRCRLTAEGLVDASMQGYRELASRLRAVEARFTLNGLKLEQPYLRPGSVDLFEVADAGGAA